MLELPLDAQTDPTVKESFHRGLLEAGTSKVYNVRIWSSHKSRVREAIEDQKAKQVTFPQATATGIGSSDIPRTTTSGSNTSQGGARRIGATGQGSGGNHQTRIG
eukprot:924150-Amphidinium_carterae.1